MAKIKIKEQNKGKFTAWAKAHGMSVQQAANTILRNKEKYSPTLIKRANFARNASKWEEGGEYSLGGTIGSLGGIVGAIPGPWSKLAGATMGLMGGMLDGSNSEQDQLAMLQTQGSQQLNSATVSNPYQSSFKFGGQFKGKRYPTTSDTYTALFKNDEVVLNPSGKVEMTAGGNEDGSDSIPVNPANGTKIIADGKPLAKYVRKYNKANEMLASGATNISKNSLTLNKNRYYSKFLDSYNQQEAKKFAKGGQNKFFGGGNYGDDPTQEYLPVNSPIDKLIYPFPKGDANYPYQLDQVNIEGRRSLKPFNMMDGIKNNKPSVKGQPFATGQSVNPNISGNIDNRYIAPNDLMELPTYGSLVQDSPSKMKFSNPLDDPSSKQFDPAKSKEETLAGMNNTSWQDKLAGIGEMAPMLYNLGQGLFGNRENINANKYRNPYEGQINSLMANRRYDINAPLLSNEAAYATARRNITNLGGPGARSNIIGAQNTKQFGDMALYGQKNNVDNQYMGEQANMMYGLGRDRSATQMTVDDMNALNRSAGRNMVGAGMSGIQQYLLTKRQDKNQLKRDKLLVDAIKAYSPYATKWIPGMENYNGR